MNATERALVQRLEELARLEGIREGKKVKLQDIDADKLTQICDDAEDKVRELNLRVEQIAWKSEAICEREEILTVAKAMQSRGGSFVRCLGEALIYADPDNALKIKIGFPEYWINYGGKALPDGLLSEAIEFDKGQEMMDDDRDRVYRDEKLENHFDMRDHYNGE